MRRDGEAHDAWQERGTKHAHLPFHPLRCVLSIITGCSNGYSKQNAPCFGGRSGWWGRQSTQIHRHTYISVVSEEAKLGNKSLERFHGDWGHCTAGLQCILNKKACLDISGTGESAASSFSCRSSWRDSWGGGPLQNLTQTPNGRSFDQLATHTQKFKPRESRGPF